MSDRNAELFRCVPLRPVSEIFAPIVVDSVIVSLLLVNSCTIETCRNKFCVIRYKPRGRKEKMEILFVSNLWRFTAQWQTRELTIKREGDSSLSTIGVPSSDMPKSNYSGYGSLLNRRK